MIFSPLVDSFIVMLLIFVRIFTVILFIPLLSNQMVPIVVKVALGLLSAMAVQLVIGENFVVLPDSLFGFIAVVVGEAMIGITIGLFVQLVFLSLNMFSEFFSTQIGLRAAQVVNPLSGVEVAVLQQLINVLVILIFISSFTLQKIFFYGIYGSYIALNAFSFFSEYSSFVSFILNNFLDLFMRSFLIAVPFLIVLSSINVGLGLFGRVAPQINLLILGIPIQLIVGFAFLFLAMPYVLELIDNVFDSSIMTIRNFLHEASK